MKRVVDEDGIVDAVRHVGRRVAGHVHGLGFEPADREALAVGEQVIERRQLLLDVEDLAEDGLHFTDALADGDAPPTRDRM